MRELFKSFFRFSWAMSLFGAQQAANVATPAKAAESFNRVSDATKQELNEITSTAFKTGDNLQKGAVDTFFDLFSAEALNPSFWIKRGTELTRQTLKVFGQGNSGSKPSEKK
jgi:hypothetical protein